MDTIMISPTEIGRTFTLITRHDTQYFLSHELPEFFESLASNDVVRFRRLFSHLRSGEYIPKASYSDHETEFVYLTIGQFSGEQVDFDSLTFLDETIGRRYEYLSVKRGDLVITRSGTVGVVHFFKPPDDKIYIPSHHLAIVELSEGNKVEKEFIRLFLQSDFARRYFWAFASGKGQKEISNWSIKSIPIPSCNDVSKVVGKSLKMEKRIRELLNLTEKVRYEKERILMEGIHGKVANK